MGFPARNLLAMPKPDTRTRLLLAAVAVIDKDGESGVNVHQIAKTAGVSVPSIYHFFGNRDGLLEEAQAHRFEEGLRLVAQSLGEALAHTGTKKQYRDTLRKWLVSVTAGTNTGFRKTRATVVASAVHNPSLASRIAEIQERHVKQMASFLRYGTERGWVDSDIDVEAIVIWTTTQLNGKLVIELDPKKRYSKQWNELFISSILHAMRFD